MAPILNDILAFIETHEISETQFGLMATRDKNLIPDLRGERRNSPRRLYPETEAKIRRAMATYRPDAAA